MSTPNEQARAAADLYDRLRESVIASPLGSDARRLHSALGDLANAVLAPASVEAATGAEAVCRCRQINGHFYGQATCPVHAPAPVAPHTGLSDEEQHRIAQAWRNSSHPDEMHGAILEILADRRAASDAQTAAVRALADEWEAEPRSNFRFINEERDRRVAQLLAALDAPAPQTPLPSRQRPDAGTPPRETAAATRGLTSPAGQGANTTGGAP